MKTSNTKDYRGIWVFIEQEEGCLSEVSLELLTAARCLAEKKKMEIGAVLLGDEMEAVAEALPGWGADRVILANHPGLKRYLAIPYTKIISQLVLERKPDIFLLPATCIGSDLAPRVAARHMIAQWTPLVDAETLRRVLPHLAAVQAAAGVELDLDGAGGEVAERLEHAGGGGGDMGS